MSNTSLKWFFPLLIIVIQGFLLAGWLIPGWPLNDAPWLLVFLPTWIAIGTFLLTVLFTLIAFTVTFLIMAADELKEDAVRRKMLKDGGTSIQKRKAASGA